MVARPSRCLRRTKCSAAPFHVSIAASTGRKICPEICAVWISMSRGARHCDDRSARNPASFLIEIAGAEGGLERTPVSTLFGSVPTSVGILGAVTAPGPTAYSRGLTCQSEAPTKAWYSAGEIDRLEYRQLITNMFLSCCQSLRTTSHSKVPPELTVIVRTSPGFGIACSSICLPNRTSLFAMVSGASFPSRRTRREGILRLISTVCAI